ncbi:50S ribosomal protein L5 [Candidatus Microgenomates bacterium]|nr:50S ribosomal protein L5 [Candidatus Microgenomates bacterium]
MAHTALKQKYEKEVKTKLAQEFEIKNPNALPKIQKIVVNMGIGALLKDKGLQEKAAEELSLITGQKAQVRPAKLSIAGFSIRAGMPVGLRVTLRGDRMYSFLDKLISIVLPRLRDFRGIPSKNFDKAGNYTLGFSEHTVFPEIDIAKVDRLKGFEITIVTSTKDPIISRKLLEYMGMPFEKEEN